MRKVHRISVHQADHCYPNAKLRWAAGLPSMIRVERDIIRGMEYPAESVCEVIAALRRTQPADTVITVY